MSVHLGDKLGLYRVLAEGGASTPAELASRAGIHERYAREWLEQQAVTGILEVDDVAKGEYVRRYSLSPAHAKALIDLDMIESQGDFNRPWVIALLRMEYLPSIPDLHARLQADPPARVADVACGVGWTSIALARAYPKGRIDGFDPDDHSIGIARGPGEGSRRGCPGPVRSPRRGHARERGSV